MMQKMSILLFATTFFLTSGKPQQGAAKERPSDDYLRSVDLESGRAVFIKRPGRSIAPSHSLFGIPPAIALDTRNTTRTVRHAPTGENENAERASSDEKDERIELNDASIRELQTLPGIGKKRADAINRLRQKRPFRRVRELLRVRGIGRKSLRRLRKLVYVRGEKISRRLKRRGKKK